MQRSPAPPAGYHHPPSGFRHKPPAGNNYPPEVTAVPYSVLNAPGVYYVQSDTPNKWMLASEPQKMAIKAAREEHDYSGFTVMYPSTMPKTIVVVGKDSRAMMLINTQSRKARLVVSTVSDALTQEHTGAGAVDDAEYEQRFPGIGMMYNSKFGVRQVGGLMCANPSCTKPAVMYCATHNANFCSDNCCSGRHD